MKFSRIFSIIGASSAMLFASAPAKADNWGCEVLLCLSNPAGPMAVAACVPPIQRLYRAIFKPRPDPFPTCDMAVNRAGQRSYATPQYADYYDACPAGTTALDQGKYAILGTREQYNRLTGGGRFAFGNASNFGRDAIITAGIGDGSGQYPSSEYSMPAKTCVSNYVGDFSSSGGDSDGGYISVGVYEKVTIIQPATNGFSIRVFLDDRLYKIVRPQL